MTAGAPTENAKVLVVFHEEDAGGATLAVLRLVPLLEERGWRFAFWVPRPSALHETLQAQHLEVYGAPRPIAHSLRGLRLPPGPVSRLAGLPGYFHALRRALREARPAIVHANTLLSLWEAVVARLGGVPVMLHVHEMVAGRAKGRAAARLASFTADTVVAVSEACAADLRRTGLGSTVVHGAVPMPTDTAPGSARGGIVVGTVGTVSRRKGSDLFVEAARLVRARAGEVEFRMIGSPDAPFEAAWARQVLERASRVGVRHEPASDVERALGEWDVFVLPSRRDPFPMAALEAMAAGLPVVATRVDGLTEQVTSRTGILTEPGDPAALADAILELASDPARRRELGDAGRQRVGDLFSLERQAEGIHQAYMAAADARRRRRADGRRRPR